MLGKAQVRFQEIVSKPAKRSDLDVKCTARLWMAEGETIEACGKSTGL